MIQQTGRLQESHHTGGEKQFEICTKCRGILIEFGAHPGVPKVFPFVKMLRCDEAQPAWLLISAQSAFQKKELPAAHLAYKQ